MDWSDIGTLPYLTGGQQEGLNLNHLSSLCQVDLLALAGLLVSYHSLEVAIPAVEISPGPLHFKTTCSARNMWS